MVLTIAGSDSGGGAGIQADLKTIHALRCYGTTAITAITCQNTLGVYGIQEVESQLLACQIRAILDDFPVRAAKTGMLHSRENILTVLQFMNEMRTRNIPVVADPVLVSSSGTPLLAKDAKEELLHLLREVHLFTPNLPEAEEILGVRIESFEGMKEAAANLFERTQTRVLLKGGHGIEKEMTGDDAVDLYCDGTGLHELRSPVIRIGETHGTGCTLSAAITSYLARGEETLTAIRKAKVYLDGALKHAPRPGRGRRPLGHGWEREGAEN